MANKKSIVIFTGPNINNLDEIPDAQDPEGLFGILDLKDKYGGETNPREILTNTFFKKQPNFLWKYIYDSKSFAEKAKPTKAHKAILKFLEFAAKRDDIKANVITQNCDDLMERLISKSKILQDSQDDFLLTKEKSLNDHLYYPFLTQVHGTERLMHCSDPECDYHEQLEPVPNLMDI